MSDPSVPLRERNRRRAEADVRAAALELFLERGYDQTSVDDIASAAGISRRTFFRYFPSKDEILFGRLDDIAEAVGRALAARHDPEPLDQIRHALGQVVFRTPPTERGKAIARLIATHPALSARQVQLSTRLEGVTADHLESRGMARRDARLLAGAVYGALNAGRHEAASSGTDPQALLARVFTLLAPAFGRARV